MIFRFSRKLILSEENDVGGLPAHKGVRLAERRHETRNTGLGIFQNYEKKPFWTEKHHFLV